MLLKPYRSGTSCLYVIEKLGGAQEHLSAALEQHFFEKHQKSLHEHFSV